MYKPLTETEMRGLLAKVPEFDDYETWLKVIAGTLALCGGNESTAESLLQGWQAEDRAGLYRQKLRSFRGRAGSAGWLVNEAKRNGWEYPKPERAAGTPTAKPLTESRPLRITSNLPRFFKDGAFFSVENVATRAALDIWVPAEMVGELYEGDVVVCRGSATKHVLRDGTARWTFWAKETEKKA